MYLIVFNFGNNKSPEMENHTEATTPNGYPNGHPDPTSYPVVQMIIIVATIAAIISVSVILCKLCSKQYRRSPGRSNYGRAPSITSIEQVVVERLQNRPPSYQESYNHMKADDAPPQYREITKTLDQHIFEKEETSDSPPPYEATVIEQCSFQDCRDLYTNGAVNPAFFCLDPNGTSRSTMSAQQRALAVEQHHVNAENSLLAVLHM